MKKVYFKNLEWNRQLELLEKNNTLLCELGDSYMQSEMDMQSEMADVILGKDWHKYITYRDNYNSFYLVLRDYREFLCNLDKDYLTSENLKLYDVLINKLDVLDSMYCYSDNYSNLENWIEEKAELLLDDVEEYLHGFEEYPSEEELLNYAIDCLNIEKADYYILVDDDNKCDDIIRLDISYTKTFN